jgi:hypothetical protein
MDPQESGVIVPGHESYGRSFGPAARDHYDPAQWTMTVSDATTIEYIPDIDPLNRVRAPGQPVVMKASKDDQLAPFISILGHIPLARKVLIELGEPHEDYGHGPNWWSGTPIFTWDHSLDPGIPPFVYEMHRLMAFMRLSTRLFGSVDPLAGLELTMNAGFAPDMTLRGDVDHFLAALSYAAKGTPGGERAAQLMQGFMNGEKAFNCLNLRVDVSNRQNDIYGAIDGMLWADDPDGDNEHDRFLVQLPPILVLRIATPSDQASDLNMDVAAELYMDRYMEQNKDRMKQMRQERAECERLVQSAGEEIEKLSFATVRGRKCSAETVIRSSIEILQRDPPSGTDGIDASTEEAAVDGPAVAVNADESKKLADRLEQLLQRLREKINGQTRVALLTGANKSQISTAQGPRPNRS